MMYKNSLDFPLNLILSSFDSLYTPTFFTLDKIKLLNF